MMADLMKVLQDAGFTGERLREAWAIVMRESGGRPEAHNDNVSTGDDSYGLFQINMLGPLGPERDAKFRKYVKGYTGPDSLFDPVVNARAAAYMSQKGSNWSSWVSPQYGSAATYYAQFPGAGASIPIQDSGSPSTGQATSAGMGQIEQDTLSVEEAALIKGFDWEFVQSHPAIRKVFEEAVANDWFNNGEVGKALFTQALEETPWFQKNSAYAQQYILDQQKGGEYFQTKLDNARVAVQAEAARIGATLPPDALDTLANAYLREGWGESGRNGLLTQALTGSLEDFDTSYLDFQRGGAATTVQQLKSVAQKNGVQFDDAYYQGAAKQILGGRESADSYMQEIRDRAASLYPAYSERIRAGENISDITSPYKTLIASTLGLNPNDVTLDNPWMKKAVWATDDKGNNVPMDMFTLQQQLRQDPAWDNSTDGQNTLASGLGGLLQRWGVGR